LGEETKFGGMAAADGTVESCGSVNAPARWNAASGRRGWTELVCKVKCGSFVRVSG